MNRNNKAFRLFSAILCTFVLLTAFSSASFAASDNGTPIIRSAEVTDGSVRIICSDMPYVSEEMSENGDYSADIGGTDIEVVKSRFGDNGIPITLVCLIDNSSSNSHEMLTLAREIAKGLAGKLRENDDFVVASVSDKLSMSEPMNNTSEISNELDDIHLTDNNSNLFNGISECVQNMSASKVYNADKILVVMSTASNYSNNGKTAQEIADEIRSARLPVYTVALMKSVDSIDNGKTLGSFARASAGGLALSNADNDVYNHIRKDASAPEFYNEIWESINSAVVLDAPVPLKLLTGENMPLTVKFGTDEQSVSDTLTLNIPASAAEAQIPEGEGESEEGQVSDEQPEEEKDNLLMYCVIGAAVVIAIVVIILLSKKKKKPEPIIGPVIDDTPTTNPTPKIAPPEIEPIEPTNVATPKYRLLFDDIPYGKSCRQFDMPEGIIKSFGRVGKKADFELNTTDGELSGKHFSIIVSGSGMCIRDDNSTNGTWVNGIRLQPNSWVKLASGDKIRAGSCEYRFTLKEN